MRILNPELEKELREGSPIKLNLGFGKKPLEGFYSLDCVDMDGVDILADLNKPLTLLPANCCQYIYTSHVLEHIQDLLTLMREIHRILSPDGVLEIIVPHFSNVHGYSDPTHVRLFGLYSMNYFVAPDNQPKRVVPEFYTSARFLIKSINIDFYRRGKIDKLFSPIFRRFVNISMNTQDFYERRLANLFHASQLRYILTPDKHTPV